MQKVKLSINTIFILFTVVAIVLTMALAATLSTKSKNLLIFNESKRYFEQSSKITQTVFDYEVKNISTFVQAASFTSDEIQSIQDGDIEAMQTALEISLSEAVQFSLILPFDHTQYASAGLYLYDIDPLVQELRNNQTAMRQRRIVAIDGATKTDLFIVALKGIVDKQSGRVVGLYVAGLELGSHIKLLSDIKSNSNLDAVSVLFDNTDILSQSTAQIDLDFIDAFQTPVFHEDQSIGYHEKLKFDSQPSRLSVKMALFNDSMTTTKDVIYKDFLVVFAFTILLLAMFVFFVNKLFINPIERLKIYASDFLQKDKSDGELQTGVKEYQELANYLHELFLIVRQNQEELLKANEKIDSDLQMIKNLNDTLEQKVHEKTQKLQEQVELLTQKDQLLQEQGKLAAMGEMIDAIAHQWKTPLTSISFYAQDIEYMVENNDMDIKDAKRDVKGILDKVEHLVETINSFREFFRPVTVIKPVSLRGLIDQSLILMKDELIKNNIFTTIEGEDMEIFLVPNEFKHILINLINNSKDAFVQNHIASRQIRFEIQKLSDYEALLRVKDNAGGIPQDIIEHIFEPNVTSKQNSGGTGIGLYISKLILDKIGARISVFNDESGAVFEVLVFNACELNKS